MGDITLILDRKELVVRMEAGTVRIDRPDSKKPERIPLKMIDRVIVIGSPMVSCDVWRALSGEGIFALLTPSRGGGPIAYMGAGLTGFVEKRMAQYKAVCDPNCSLAVSRRLLSLKLSGQENVLKKMSKDPEHADHLCEPIRKNRADLQKADCQSSLMGHEGAAAACYFKILSGLIPEKWQFSGRNRRPPRDPVNALLSLSYVIAGSDVRQAVHESGLDPSMGFLHSVQNGRESLALDILEPIRPDADEFVLNLLAENVVTLSDFSSSLQDGCLLGKSGRRAFYGAWSVWQTSENRMQNFKAKAKALIQELIQFFLTAVSNK